MLWFDLIRGCSSSSRLAAVLFSDAPPPHIMAGAHFMEAPRPTTAAFRRGISSSKLDSAGETVPIPGPPPRVSVSVPHPVHVPVDDSTDSPMLSSQFVRKQLIQASALQSIAANEKSAFPSMPDVRGLLPLPCCRASGSVIWMWCVVCRSHCAVAWIHWQAARAPHRCVLLSTRHAAAVIVNALMSVPCCACPLLCLLYSYTGLPYHPSWRHCLRSMPA